MGLINISNQTLALAGIAQVCSLVNQLATKGSCLPPAMEASISSLLKVDSDSVADVFGGVIGVEHGLQQLQLQLANRSQANAEQTRYAAQLVYLQKKLVNNTKMQSAISVGVAKAQAQSEHFGLLHENVLANLADIYHTTISTMPPRILVHGDPQYLGSPNIVNKIRALLLAGIRSTLLWRQCGGSRWKLLLARNKILDEAQFLLTQV